MNNYLNKPKYLYNEKSDLNTEHQSWLDDFEEFYILLNGSNKVEVQDKIRLLKNLIGQKLRAKTFRNFDESMTDYVYRLRQIARNCDYKVHDMIVADQLLYGCNSKKLQRELIHQNSTIPTEIFEYAKFFEVTNMGGERYELTREFKLIKLGDYYKTNINNIFEDKQLNFNVPFKSSECNKFYTKLLEKYKAIFSDTPGLISHHYHAIDTNDTHLKLGPIYPIPPHLNGFWQIPLKPKDKHKTDFAVGRQLYHFNVMPFGLQNAPATCQRIMNAITHNVENVHCYMDDILVCSKTRQGHFEDLSKLFECLKNAGLTLKPSKCKIDVNEVKFLGHLIDQNGIRMDRDKWYRIRREIYISEHMTETDESIIQIVRLLEKMGKMN
ncbi:hypothetical protein A3Q56_06009, partial [Intoshia linei]